MAFRLDRTILKPLGNAGFLLSGRVAGAVMHLAALSLAARTLGPAKFGVLVLLYAVLRGAAELLKFKSWQAVVQYGTPIMARDDRAGLQRLLKFTLGMDLLSALVAAVLIALLGGFVLAAVSAATASGQIGDAEKFLYWLAPAMPFVLIAGTCGGVLRLFDRFDLIGARMVVPPAARVAGAAVLFATGASLGQFVILWSASLAAGGCVYLALAGYELRRRGLLRGLAPDLAGVARPAPGIWRFMAGTNGVSAVAVVQTQLGTIFAGVLLGPAGAGLYRVAKQVADVLWRPANRLLGSAIYPEFARRAARGQKRARRGLALTGAVVALGLALAMLGVLAGVGRPLLRLIGGQSFGAAYGVMLILAAAGVLAAALFPLEPLLLSAKRVGVTLATHVVAAIVYVAAAWTLTRLWGLEGLGVAFVAYVMVLGLAQLAALRARRRRR